MDLLYRAYSNPMDLMNMYINQGRFGTFVKGFLDAEYERRKEEAEKDYEWRLWVAYVHSYSDLSYDKWKEKVCKPVSTTGNGRSDSELTDDGIRSIMNRLFPA
jgi:hypothetical protein